MFSKKVNLSNSIYQQKGAGYGLTQNHGMLINNRFDGQTGIQQISQARKEMKRAEKISTYAQAVKLGNQMEDMGECCS